MSPRNFTISALACSFLSLSVLRCFLLCASVSPFYLRKLLRKVVFKNHFTRLVLTLHTFQFSHVLGESPLSHLQMFTPVSFTSISIRPSSSGSASSCCSSNCTDCFFRSFSIFLTWNRWSRSTFLPWSAGLCTPAHGLHHMTKTTLAKCEHSLSTTLQMLPMQPCWNVGLAPTKLGTLTIRGSPNKIDNTTLSSRTWRLKPLSIAAVEIHLSVYGQRPPWNGATPVKMCGPNHNNVPQRKIAKWAIGTQPHNTEES